MTARPAAKEQAEVKKEGEKSEKKSDQKARKPGEEVNRIIATIKTEPITLVDLEKAKEQYRKVPKFVKYRERPVESQILDVLVARAIVNLIADQESIRVPPARVENEIKNRMEKAGFSKESKFREAIEKELKMDYDFWKNEILAFEIKKEQLIQIRVQPPRPSDEEVKKWYKINKAKIGREVRVREIIFKPASRSLSDQVTAEKKLQAIRNQAARGSKSFGSLARTGNNISTYRASGGLTGWRNLAEIAKQDIIYANQAFQLRRKGQISPVFRTKSGNYAIVQKVGDRFIPLDKVYGLVQSKLAYERRELAFFDWIEKQRRYLGVEIDYDEYKSR